MSSTARSLAMRSSIIRLCSSSAATKIATISAIADKLMRISNFHWILKLFSRLIPRTSGLARAIRVERKSHGDFDSVPRRELAAMLTEISRKAVRGATLPCTPG